MDILFDKHHPKNLIEAIRLIHSMDLGEHHNISLYDSKINDGELVAPILLRVDKQKRGLEPVTEILFENGFRIFALKFPKDGVPDMFELSLFVMSLWPDILKLIREKKDPFIYKSNLKSRKLIPIKK